MFVSVPGCGKHPLCRKQTESARKSIRVGRSRLRQLNERASALSNVIRNAQLGDDVQTSWSKIAAGKVEN